MRFENRTTLGMLTKHNLIAICESYRALCGIERETTLSYRIFGDTKKLRLLRVGESDLTLTRFYAALDYLLDNWPESAPLHSDLARFKEWRIGPNRPTDAFLSLAGPVRPAAATRVGAVE